MKQIDLVIAGMDLSGTSTQVKFLVKYLQNKGLTVKDLKGTESDVLFHSDIFSSFNKGFISYDNFLESSNNIFNQLDSNKEKLNFYNLQNKMFRQMHSLESKPRLASMVKIKHHPYINPNLADFWLLEEPTKRGAGQNIRNFGLHRGDYGLSLDQWAAILDHQSYRESEFYRFRKPILDAKQSIIRSRSEESGCYQVEDVISLKEGVNMDDLIRLPGSKVAFSNPPTHVFAVHGPKDMTAEQYISMRLERDPGRELDDHEKDVSYQLLVNKRYATDWLDNFYKKACNFYGSTPPKIIQFPLNTTIKEKEQMMASALDIILSE